MIKIDRKKIKKDIERTKKRLGRLPTSSFLIEKLGRGYRSLGEIALSENHFQSALEAASQNSSDGARQEEHLGVLYRLFGKHDEAKKKFLKAYDLYHEIVFSSSEILDTYLEYMVKLAYISDKHDEAIDHLHLLSSITNDLDRELICYYVVDLIQASRTNNLELAQKVSSQIEQTIKSEQMPPTESGYFTLWDLYEDAVAIIKEIEIQAS